MRKDTGIVVMLGGLAALLCILFPDRFYTTCGEMARKSPIGKADACDTKVVRTSPTFILAKLRGHDAVDMESTLMNLGLVIVLTAGSLLSCESRHKTKVAVAAWKAKWADVDDSQETLLRASQQTINTSDTLLRSYNSSNAIDQSEMLRPSQLTHE